nr:HAD-IC family P-type ATPase [Tessaracoccus sp. OS52]
MTSDEVASRVADGKVNTLPDRSGRSTGQIIRANVFTRVNVMLFVLFVLVMSTGHFTQGLFGTLIVANSIIGIVQELRAKRTLDRLAVVGEAHPAVIRDGVRHTINRDDVVLDDLIVVGPGDQIVVDGEVVWADYLELDESMLTGEADPEPKLVGDKVLSGAFIVAGSGYYRAQKVGADAYAAQITAQAAKFTLVNSELRQGIDSILKFISFLLVPVGILTIWVQFNQEDSTWQEMVLRMTGALVPMVPEGLVLLTSMAFALGVIRLGRRNALVQELPAIEGLARVSVVCTDKTGTLTENAMTLGEVVGLDDADEAQVREVLAQLVAVDPAPNASMQAIAAALEPAARLWDLTARAPFTSTKKWSGASFADEGSWLIGAPDVLADGDVAARAEEIGADGRRVLLLARGSRSVDAIDAPGELQAVALLVLDQVIRPDAAETLDYFRGQDVRIKVISGDNAASVGAVTRSLGMSGEDAVDARTLPDDEDGFISAVNSASVFGRVKPEQKRRMVGALQASGQSVAMTGDGVNDVLALKDADLGVAMGSGSAATRSVAQIVLLDNRFATLPHVVAEGRRVIGNIERVAKLFLTKTVYAATLALLVGLLGLPSPFLPLHMTIVGWFTIGIPAFLLSLAPNRERARTGFVRRTLMAGVPFGLIIATVAFVTYVLTRGLGEVSDTIQTQASTATLAALIMTASWVLAVVSRPWFLWRVALVAFGYVFYAAIFLWEPAAAFFHLDISNTAFMLVGIAAGAAGMVAVELTWWVTAAIRGHRPLILPQRAAADNL